MCHNFYEKIYSHFSVFCLFNECTSALHTDDENWNCDLITSLNLTEEDIVKKRKKIFTFDCSLMNLKINLKKMGWSKDRSKDYCKTEIWNMTFVCEWRFISQKLFFNFLESFFYLATLQFSFNWIILWRSWEINW